MTIGSFDDRKKQALFRFVTFMRGKVEDASLN